ncbi:MAG: Zn-ribbon domain-containing OB-fold protein [Rudaea sp.]
MSSVPLNYAGFNKHLAEHRLMGTRCRTDGSLYLPPREMCPSGHADMEWAELSGEGRLESFTIIYVGPSSMIAAGYDRKNPYCVGVVRLDEGPAISAQILGVDVKHPDQIKIGMPLHAAYVERGEGQARRTFLAFEPAG